MCIRSNGKSTNGSPRASLDGSRGRPSSHDCLRARDHFVGRGWENEFYVLSGVGCEGLRNVQSCQVDFLVPVAIGVVVAARVHYPLRDGVVADLLAMPVAKNQYYCGKRHIRDGLRRWIFRSRFGVFGAMLHGRGIFRE